MSAQSRRTNAQMVRVLMFIQEFERTRHYSPSVREIADGVGISSTSVVVRHLRMLRTAGVLTFVDGESRTIVLREEREAA